MDHSRGGSVGALGGSSDYGHHPFGSAAEVGGPTSGRRHARRCRDAVPLLEWRHRTGAGPVGLLLDHRRREKGGGNSKRFFENHGRAVGRYPGARARQRRRAPDGRRQAARVGRHQIGHLDLRFGGRRHFGRPARRHSWARDYGRDDIRSRRHAQRQPDQTARSRGLRDAHRRLELGRTFRRLGRLGNGRGGRQNRGEGQSKGKRQCSRRPKTGDRGKDRRSSSEGDQTGRPAAGYGHVEAAGAQGWRRPSRGHGRKAVPDEVAAGRRVDDVVHPR